MQVLCVLQQHVAATCCSHFRQVGRSAQSTYTTVWNLNFYLKCACGCCITFRRHALPKQGEPDDGIGIEFRTQASGVRTADMCPMRFVCKALTGFDNVPSGLYILCKRHVVASAAVDVP